MAYLALYRKYRPKCFKDILEQAHIVSSLQNQIEHNRVSHAYLFCGTHGTGKTTTAKIFAKRLNCLFPEQNEPCNHCENCKKFEKNVSLNIIEIDAASNNGVDHIRELREDTKYTPSDGLYKIYIIDEAHMLSTGAFNALLKTLEEPPPFIIFILATSDTRKIPATILSRLQRFDFKRITKKAIYQHLRKIASMEQIEIEDQALEQLSYLADGSVRDALSLLDQIISLHADQLIRYEDALDLTQSSEEQFIDELAKHLLKRDKQSVLSTVLTLHQNGKDMSILLEDLLLYFRNLLLSTKENDANRLQISEEKFYKYHQQQQSVDKEYLYYIIRMLSKEEYIVKYAKNSRLVLEVALLTIMDFYADSSIESLLLRLKNLEERVERTLEKSQLFEEENLDKKSQAEQKQELKPPTLSAKSQESDAKIADIIKDFHRIHSKASPILAAFLMDIELKEEDRALIIYSDKASFLQNKKEEIKELIATVFQTNLTLIIKEKNKPDPYQKIYDTFDLKK